MRRQEAIDRLRDAIAAVRQEGTYTAQQQLRTAVAAALEHIDTSGALVWLAERVDDHLSQGD